MTQNLRNAAPCYHHGPGPRQDLDDKARRAVANNDNARMLADVMAAARAARQGLAAGGILSGAAQPAHVLTPSSSVRRIVNMTALAVVDAASIRIGA